MTSYENQFQEAENQRQIAEKKRKEKERRAKEQADEQRQTARLNRNRTIYSTIEQYDSEIRKMLTAYHKVHFADYYCRDAEVSLSTNFDEEDRITEVSWRLPYCEHGIYYARVSIHLNLERTLFSRTKVKGFRIEGIDKDTQTSLSTKEVAQAMAESRPKWIENLSRDGG